MINAFYFMLKALFVLEIFNRAGPKLTQDHLSGDKFKLVSFYRTFSIHLEKIR